MKVATTQMFRRFRIYVSLVIGSGDARPTRGAVIRPGHRVVNGDLALGRRSAKREGGCLDSDGGERYLQWEVASFGPNTKGLASDVRRACRHAADHGSDASSASQHAVARARTARLHGDRAGSLGRAPAAGVSDLRARMAGATGARRARLLLPVSRVLRDAALRLRAGDAHGI